MASCTSKGEQTPALDLTNFDESVALNEDFYQHVTAPLPRALAAVCPSVPA